MSYAERAYFEGEPCAHVAAFEERARLRMIAKRNARLVREIGERRSGSRATVAVAFC
jgi:hypothetical protein